jgi:hypothetical protein
MHQTQTHRWARTLLNQALEIEVADSLAKHADMSPLAIFISDHKQRLGRTIAAAAIDRLAF